MVSPVLNRDAIWKKIGYSPHAKQQLFHESLARFKSPACGRRFGKSMMAAVEALSNKKYNLFQPGVRGWVVAPKYKLGEYEFRYIWEFARRLGVLRHRDTRKAYNVRTGEMFIQFPWGSRLDVMSAQHRDSLVGEGLHFVIMSEAAKQDKVVFDKYVRPSLADHIGWAAFPSTPEGFNWYFKHFNLGRRDKHGMPVDGGNHHFESWNFPSWENPEVYPGGRDDPEIKLLEATLPEDVFWQEIGASFRSTVGLIYSEWDEDLHIIDEYEYNPDWPNYLTVDWGFTNEFCALDIQVDPSDNLYVWRERYVPRVPVHQHAQEINARPNPEGYSIDGVFADYADPGACEVFSSLVQTVYADKESKDWARGVAEVKRFLIGEDGRPHIFVYRAGCPNTIEEFPNYRMKPQNQENLNRAEQASPFQDHALDAIRYLVMHLFVLGAGRYKLSDVIEMLTPEEDSGIFTRSEDSVFSMGSGIRW